MPKKRSRRAKLGRFAYQVKVTLVGAKPPIWRRLLVKDDTDLHRLHLVIQDAMGWENSHLYQFEIDETRYTEFFDDGFVASDEAPASSVRLGDLALEEGDSFLYNYDFGDDWYHECEIEKIATVERGAEYPRCLAGRRACPPEDCGGIYGYDSMLSALRSRSHPDREHWVEWIGPSWDADAFDQHATDEFIRAAHSGRTNK
ncbi:plasmid pRiA4b ORF-3 family protein [bacterium]|nr:plasmid pRiA4b ORF-3 family protein [bacterium]